MKTKMHSVFLFSIISALMALTQPSKSPTSVLENRQMCQTTNSTFQDGEVLTYKIFYNWNFMWVSAGEVTFKVWDEGEQYHYQAIGDTYDSYEWFFSVHDRYDSWVAKNTLLPNYSERSVEEGKYHIFEKIAFNQSSRNATVWRADKRGSSETKTEHPTKDCVQDVLSSLYTLRNVEFGSQEAGFTFPFHVFMDKEEFSLETRYKGKDPNKKVHNIGRYRTLKFQPDVIAGNVFSEKSKMTVWVSDDENRIPILIESPVSVGSIKIVLKNYKGLKYKFTAKVD